VVETLLDSPTKWLSGDGPDAAIAVNCRVRLSRSLADFSFPARCSVDELRSIEERLVRALEDGNLPFKGCYCTLLNLDLREARFLIERQLVTEALVQAQGPRGVYIADDQCVSIMINGEDHLCHQVCASGFQLQEAWGCLNLIDDALAGTFDFAFDERLGYLNTDVGSIGTGLRAGVVVHLPALTMSGSIPTIEHQLPEDYHRIEVLFGNFNQGHGDLYELSNSATLGRSEEEIIFHLKEATVELMARERAAREAILAEGAYGLKDRIGRALGVARGAQMLELGEAMSILSSIRFGVATGLVDGHSVQHLNKLLVGAQSAHLEVKRAQRQATAEEKTPVSSELALNVERVHLFRTCFS